MPSAQAMQQLTELLERTNYTLQAARRSEDEYNKDKFCELASHINDLALHVKQLQLEVHNLAELHNKPTR